MMTDCNLSFGQGYIIELLRHFKGTLQIPTETKSYTFLDLNRCF